MPSLDVEQQLRELEARRQQEKQAKGLTEPKALPKVTGFVNWTEYGKISGLATPLIMAMSVFAVVLLASPLLHAKIFGRRHKSGGKSARAGSHSGKKSSKTGSEDEVVQEASQLELNIRGTRAVLISSSLTPFAFSALLVLWLGLLVANVTVTWMRYAAIETELGGDSSTAVINYYSVPFLSYQWARAGYEKWLQPLSVSPLLLTDASICFLLEILGLYGVWLYVMSSCNNVLSQKPMAAGSLPSLITFVASFYQSISLDADDPARGPMWLTHYTFMMSLFMAFSFTWPLLRRDIREAMHEIQNHGPNALFKDRPEMRELKARLRQETAAVAKKEQ